jgi:hypothetical protein
MRINMKDKVQKILLLKEAARNNDFYLMYWIWKNEFDHINTSDKMTLDFDRINIVNILTLLNEKKLSHPSGIMRARRKVQEDNPILRGVVWKARHKEQEVVKQDLGYQQVAQ